MIRVDTKDLYRAMDLIRAQSNGAPVTFKTDGASLKIQITDKQGKDMTLELSDVNYPMMPKVTKTETF